MKEYIFILILLLFTSIGNAQKLQCSCSTNASINETISGCKVDVLNDKSKLYYQFNCDSVWLTLEKANKQKMVIYSMNGELYKELYNYHFRIGYQFSHEFKKYLLFRSGCPANGPCNFVLVNKNTGKTFKELGELIYDHGTNKFYDFLLSLSNKNGQTYLRIYYPDNNTKHVIRLKSSALRGVVPEYEFDAINVMDKTLTLKYLNQTLKIDLSKYPG